MSVTLVPFVRDSFDAKRGVNTIAASVGAV
jgi:hypothetical protein